MAKVVRVKRSSLPAYRRILVTGSRTWEDRAFVERVLTRLFRQSGRQCVLVVGYDSRNRYPRGVDQMAWEIWLRLGGVVEEHPASWSVHDELCNCPSWKQTCWRAGFRRNSQMVRRGADLCVAFILDQSKGATHCAGEAALAGIEVWEYACQTISEAQNAS